MTEQDNSKHGLLVEGFPNGYEVEDPRNTSTILGEQVILGDTIFPDRTKYPGWSLTLFSFQNRTDKDGCLFTVAPNTPTPIGLVGEPPNKEKGSHFTEWLIKGSGYLLVESPEGVVQEIEVSVDNPKVYKYGIGTKVAYIAGESGLEGINIGTPSQIPEDPLPDGDPRASSNLWKKYKSLTSGATSNL